MKREVKATLAFACLLAALGLVWFLLEGTGDPSAGGPSAGAPSAGDSGQGATSSARSPLPDQGPEAAPAAPSALASVSPAAQPKASVPGATPGRASALADSPAPASSFGSEAYLSGRLTGPDGSPLQAEVYAFQTGAHVAHSFSEYGDETPTEVEAVARVLTRGQSGYLTSVRSDEAGNFRFRRNKLGDVEVVLAAATEGCAGGVRLPPSAHLVDLQLDARRTLRVVVVTRRPLAEATVSADLGETGELPFPGLDEAGATEISLPRLLPGLPRLELDFPGWVLSHREVTSGELEAGLVTWTLNDDLIQLSGRVLTPGGRAWPKGELQFGFQESLEAPPRTWGDARTDAEGNFACKGFPPGREVEVEIKGSKHHAYYRALHPARADPLTIQLQPSSVLRIKVEGSEEEVGTFGLDWRLERWEEQGWRRVPRNLFGRQSEFAGFDEEEPEDLDRYFSLEQGLTEVLGLGPGRYRVLVEEHSESAADPLEVELPRGGAASCTLKPKRKVPTRLRGVLVHAATALAGKEVSISYELEHASFMHRTRIGANGEFAFETYLPKPTQAMISISEHRLSAALTLDPEAPELGTIILEER